MSARKSRALADAALTKSNHLSDTSKTRAPACVNTVSTGEGREP
jgi:hypothetical protein